MTAAAAMTSRVHDLTVQTLDLLAEEDPLADYLEGYPGFEDRLADLEPGAGEGLRARAVAVAGEAERLAEVARSTAPEGDDWVTCALVVQQAEAVAARIDARLVEHTMVDFGVSPVGRLLGALPLCCPAGEQAERGFLARLAAIPRYLASAADRHREGIASGRLPVAERVQRAVASLDAYLGDEAVDPLRRPPLGEPHAAERDRLLAEAVRPAFAAYRDVLAREVVPHGRSPEQPGLCWLPGGEATYAALARTHTTTDHTPEELHRIGLDLAAELAEEYRRVGSAVFGQSTVEDVREHLRSDPDLRWDGAEELLAVTQAAISRAEAVAPAWFGWVPSQPCALEPVPEAEAPTSPSAYYVPPALEGSRPGTYFANTHRAGERARYVAEVTAFHEAVPGHHYQLTLAQGLTGLPELRRLAWINAYIEGWGLYAERLAEDMELYSRPLDRLGMVAVDSLRAARLVVDTGLHAFGWTRQQAVEYLRAHTVMAEVEIQQETDRYIEYPGQALSYMVGRLEIQRLRARAERELGAGFDLRAFHDVVLGSGALPLSVLDEVLARWTASQGRGTGVVAVVEH